MNGWRTARAVRRNWWLVLLGLAVGSMVAWGLTVTATPRYEARTDLLLKPAGEEVRGVLFQSGGAYLQDRVNLYADLARGERLTAVLAARTDIDLTSQQIQQRINAHRVEQTALIRVAVTDTDRRRAGLLAGAFVEEFGKLVTAIEPPISQGPPLITVEPIAGPTIDPRPVWPQPQRNLGIGLLMGLVASLLVATARESLDRKIRTPDQLVVSAAAPVIAVLPRRSRLRRQPVVVTDDCRPAAEPFRQLRTRLSRRDGSVPAQVLAVTSPVHREGRSTTAVNLALAFAATGKRVLLLEADWRGPRIARYLRLEPGPGLSDVLAGRKDLTGAVRRVGRSTLWVLPAGASPHNPSELLDSPEMAALLHRERAAYDLIVIDTPPVLPTADAAVMAGHADGVVLVARAGRVTDQQVRAAVEILRDLGAGLLGCVLNDIPRTDAIAARHTNRSGVAVRPVVPAPTHADTPHRPAYHPQGSTGPAGAVSARSAAAPPARDSTRPLGSAR